MNQKDQQIKTLTEQNDDLENYFRNTIIPQLFIDANLILRKYTPPAMIQFKLSQGDIGRSIHDIINNLRYPSIIENIQHVISTAEILEKEIQTTDLRWFQMNILPYVQREDNKTNGVIITFVEITSRIEDLKEQESLIADHETLLDTIAHDIKNPLTSLLLSVEILNSAVLEDPKKLKPILISVENGVKRLQSIINELTEAREERHKYGTNGELINIENIIEDVRFILLDSIKESGATMTSNVHVSELFFVRRKLRSILYNLINNAIKFKSPDRKPEIFIKTIQEDDFIVLSIQDNGIGIDASKQNAVFSKFYRVNNTIEGSGMGLYLVKELVTNAGGKILIESQLDKGTEFKIYLKANLS